MVPRPSLSISLADHRCIVHPVMSLLRHRHPQWAAPSAPSVHSSPSKLPLPHSNRAIVGDLFASSLANAGHPDLSNSLSVEPLSLPLSAHPSIAGSISPVQPQSTSPCLRQPPSTANDRPPSPPEELCHPRHPTARSHNVAGGRRLVKVSEDLISKRDISSSSKMFATREEGFS